MSAVGDIGYGAKVYCDDDGGSGMFTAFVAVTQITAFDQEQATVEATHLNSPGRYREYVAGMVEPGTFGFTQRYTNDAYDRVVDLKGQTRFYRVEFPDGGTVTAEAILTKHMTEVSAVDAMVDIKVECKVTGSVTWVQN